MARYGSRAGAARISGSQGKGGSRRGGDTLPARAPRRGPHQASAGTPPGPYPPPPPPIPASGRRCGSILDAGDRRWRQRCGWTWLPSSRLALLDRMDRTEADLDPVPSVDCDDQQGERHLLVLGELRLQCAINVVGRVGLRHQRQSLGPRKRGPLALAVEWRFAPGIEQVKALLGLAMLSRIGGMPVQTASAATDLRRPDLHEFHQAVLQAAL